MRANPDPLTHHFKERLRSKRKAVHQREIRSAAPPYLKSFLERTFATKKTTCSFLLLQPSQKAFAGPSRPPTLVVYPRAVLPLPVCGCSSFGKSFLLDTGESKKQREPLSL